MFSSDSVPITLKKVSNDFPCIEITKELDVIQNVIQNVIQKMPRPVEVVDEILDKVND